MDNTQPIQKSSPRDVFMYLLATILLFFCAWSVINLSLEYMNVAFPDPLNPLYNAGDAIRWSLALLIIMFPVYFWVVRFLNRDITKEPAKSEIRIRKWLLYFTLFIAALLIIGDLVALIYNFLQGEITPRFLLKVAFVLAVAAAVFWYYLYDLRKAPGTFSRQAKLFVWGVLIALLAVVVAGFFIAGSPFTQRSIRFDGQKVNDLQSLQYQIVNYWQQKGKLPATLSDLNDSISGFAAPVDPQTGVAYEYITTASTSFQLCANFNLPSAAGQSGGGIRTAPIGPYPYGGDAANNNWDHGAGRQCFSRSIDPQMYKPVKN
ncbi:MAG: hypothetical protein KGJ13_04025 [Patescibacteria group bacterium]|nr:hypothetical protein [Patescibacteria group bacterium]